MNTAQEPSNEALDLTLVARLTRVAKACAYVQKDGTNNFHKYRFASASAVLAHVNAALAAEGVAVLSTDPSIVSTEGAGKERVVTVRMQVILGCATDDARACFVGLGSGMDAGDKAVMKATTAATKYAWMSGLNIATGDDPEADEETDKRTSGAKPKAGTEGRVASRRAPPVDETSQESAAPDPATVHPALGAFYARLGEIELPGEAVAVWMKHRADLAPLPVADREAAWRALCTRTELVGRMKNAKVWLRKAVEEEDARRKLSGGSDSQAA